MKDTPEQVLNHAREMLAREDLAWIRDSALRLRAFYWGMLCGLGQPASDEVQKRVRLELVVKTMFALPADDPFNGTELESHVRTIREQLLRVVETDRRAGFPGAIEEPGREQASRIEVTGELFEPLMNCIQELDDRWADHRQLVRHELTRIKDLSARDVVETLKRLENSFRVLGSADRSARNVS